MALLSIGPENMSEDEEKIASGYRLWQTIFIAAVPFVVASRWDIKWVVAAGFAIIAIQLHEAGGRLPACARTRIP